LYISGFNSIQIPISDVFVISETQLSITVPLSLVTVLVDVKLEFYVRNTEIPSETLINAYTYVYDLKSAGSSNQVSLNSILIIS
jgi:hypothetical protein